MKIAVIGSGVSGLVAARLLATRHDVQLFEAAEIAGGHANTVDVEIDGRQFAVDTGFMVFNDRTYPLFTRMLELLEIEAQPSDMSFSVSCERTGLEYQGSSLGGLFAQRKNLLRPKFFWMLLEIVRFNRLAKGYLTASKEQITLGEFLKRMRFCAQLRDHYLLPMTAAIWSCPTNQVLDFPARFLFQFMENHGLLQLKNRPKWLTIPGGSRKYVDALIQTLGKRVHLGSPVKQITRHPQGVLLEFFEKPSRMFDVVVLATHADTSLRLLSDANDTERTLLSAFPYQPNEAILHTDESWLPQRKAAWASWNYRISANNTQVCVTYDLTRLQQINSPRRLLVTLNPPRDINPRYVLRKFSYQHPVFSTDAIVAQSRWSEFNGQHRTHFCGAYWRHGFHEDGVASALAVTEKFGIGLEACTAPCITAQSLTPAVAR
jgi:predicted NAD/FAD-binding protein